MYSMYPARTAWGLWSTIISYDETQCKRSQNSVPRRSFALSVPRLLWGTTSKRELYVLLYPTNKVNLLCNTYGLISI